MLLHADARALPIADASVDCVVTSPPYWGLRDYGHAGQIGLEPTPEAYVAALVGVARELWRVLAPTGTLWLNLGDSYASGGTGGYSDKSTLSGFTNPDTKGRQMNAVPRFRSPAVGFKPKDLVGIPWRVAFALQADGWYLRSDIIWAKPNPMPESVTDRPTKAHEYVFLLAKAERYYYDAAAISERSTYAGKVVSLGDKSLSRGQAAGMNVCASGNGTAAAVTVTERRNARSVWTMTTDPYAGAHFATMPPALVERCVLAGCPLGGLVLDPFIGSGTVGEVAERLGRRWLGVDLAYHDLARERTAQRGLQFA